MPDPFIMAGGWASPGVIVIGACLVLLVGWAAKEWFGE